MATFTCKDCGASFSLSDTVLDRYPGWQPQRCRSCMDGGSGPASGPGGSGGSASDPDTGVFTDGGASPNPGPGGWGAVYVVSGEIAAEVHGRDPATTNNRMELTALIEGMKLIPEGTPAVVYSDSNLAVRTLNEWAADWERRGWKRKRGPVENVDLIKKAYRSYRSRPEVEIRWIKAHSTSRWNEYADELANRWRTSGNGR